MARGHDSWNSLFLFSQLWNANAMFAMDGVCFRAGIRLFELSIERSSGAYLRRLAFFPGFQVNFSSLHSDNLMLGNGLVEAVVRVWLR